MEDSILLASSNPGKATEINTIFSNLGISASIQPAEKKLEVDECGTTFKENAFIKAKAYFDQFKSYALADDSGLVVPALPDILGVHSARFAPELQNYDKKCEKLIKLLNQNIENDRNAYFVCVLCLYLSHDEIFFFEGRIEGEIGQELRGHEGFGYDPIFIPNQFVEEGKTLAQLGDWKQENSHRFKALEQMGLFLKNRLNKNT